MTDDGEIEMSTWRDWEERNVVLNIEVQHENSPNAKTLKVETTR